MENTQATSTQESGKANGKPTQTVAEGRTLTLTGAILKLAMIFAEEDPDGHSFNYCVEDAIVKGIDTIRNRRKNSLEGKNRREFQAELKRNPAIVADPVEMAKLIKKYAII